jgi:hypothetical protein
VKLLEQQSELVGREEELARLAQVQAAKEAELARRERLLQQRERDLATREVGCKGYPCGCACEVPTAVFAGPAWDGGVFHSDRYALG